MIELQDEIKEAFTTTPPATIKIIGIGGAGGNTVNSIVSSGCNFIETIAVNTDAQALHLSKAHHKVQIGIKSTKGLGAGANPELGKRAAEEDLDKIIELLSDTDIVFLTGGMGGGTGSGAMPTIARALSENDILSIAIVTVPFEFEGKRRARIAQDTIELLKKEVDTLIIIPNQKLLDLVDKNVSMIDAFAMINDVLMQSVKGITDIIRKPGHINVDFADVRTIMKGMGLAVMGSAKASGENRAQEATLRAITSPLLDNMRIKGAHGVLINITGDKNLSLHEISQAAQIIYEEADEDAHIILGSVIDETLVDEVSVTIIATGFEVEDNKQAVNSVTVQPAKKEPVCTKEIADQQFHNKDQVTQSEIKAYPEVSVEQPVKQPETFCAQQINYKTGPQPSEHQKIEANPQHEPSSFDPHDLDIPTFLRKDQNKEQSSI